MGEKSRKAKSMLLTFQSNNNQMKREEKETDKKIPFDNLYTGYEAQVTRYPKNTYNRDIIMYLIMFGYKYKNS